MGVYINGMEMPKDGRKHTAVIQFLEDRKCRAIVEYSKSYDDRSIKVFEAVPLPEWHGRLIDERELLHDYEGLRLFKGDFRLAFERIIERSNTLVPAEEDGEYCRANENEEMSKVSKMEMAYRESLND